MRNIRISIACVAFILLMFGIVMVYSSSAIYASETCGDSLFFLKRHLLALILGFIFTFFVMSLDCEYIKAHSKKIIFFAVLLLISVLIPGVGKIAGGARRWIDLGQFSFQPSEIAKIAILIYMAGFINRKENKISPSTEFTLSETEGLRVDGEPIGRTIKDFFNGFLPPLLILGLVMFLVLLEPDLGTAVTIGVIGLIILFISGARLRHLLLTIFFSIPFLYYLIFNVPYRKKRLLVFLNPWLDEKGAGFQIVQSFLALGSGGLFGVGLGQSRQKLFFLPASHTDFIFSIIGEELGFIGAFSLIVLFAVLIWQGARAAFKVNDGFRKTLIFGIVFTIGFEVIVNTGVAIG
ncbi:MAG: cell division protein FtsW, partial [Candidatus Omnitrophica bacterium]|nr:cell division protein FtsW [Candidatus Omnitrophota bacterium]